MTIFALGFATMLLALQVYSFSQPKGKKVPIWFFAGMANHAGLFFS